MSFQFTQATRQGKHLRMAIIAPSGAGKTYSALSIATGLGGRIGVLDTENSSARLYAPKPGEPADPENGTFDFVHLDLDTHSPQTYVQAIEAAENAGIDVLIIDSLSHAWAGKDGALEMKDQAAKRQRDNSFTAWRDVTAHHNRLVDKMVGCRLHLIVTMRAKTEYVQEKDERGKTVVRKVGMRAIQRDGLEYEFDVVGDMNVEHELVVSKTRCKVLTDQVIARPGAKLAAVLRDWLGQAPIEPPRQPAQTSANVQTTPQSSPPEDPEYLQRRNALVGRCKAAVNGLIELGVDWKPIWSERRAPTAGSVTPANVDAFEAAIVAAEAILAEKQGAAEPAAAGAESAEG